MTEFDACASRYTGKERDSESGLDMFGARYYGSSLGRFMTPDWAAKPVTVPFAHFGNPQSLNLYSYVVNNPTTTADPDGHCIPFCAITTAIANWISSGISRDGSGGAFAKNVGIGLAKGAGQVGVGLGAGLADKAVPGAAIRFSMTNTGANAINAVTPSNQTQAQVAPVGAALASTAVTMGISSGIGALEGALSSSAGPSLVGFSQNETAMIGQSMNTLSGAGYDLSPLQTLIKADMPPGCCAMSLSAEPTGAALGDGAFSSQQMLDHTLEEELLHLNQNLPSQTFGPGTASEMEAGVDAARKIPQPNQ